ncbi:MAG: hypothetical protein DMD89_37375 [Candidatus Rokuibacteriota bacterium]|nr:MAG: hypothetical protein DMD89_37375 [Candidatus Rokubacteria bacterium]
MTSPDNLDLVKTGIKGLDEILFGGIPRGNIILVRGNGGDGEDDARGRVRVSRRPPVQRAGRDRPVRSGSGQAHSRRGALQVGLARARA